MTSIVRRCQVIEGNVNDSEGEVGGEEVGGVTEDRGRAVGEEESNTVRTMVNSSVP